MKVAEIYTKDKDGNISKSSVMKGESAFDSAKIGGFTGTQQDFYETLGKINEMREEIDLASLYAEIKAEMGV